MKDNENRSFALREAAGCFWLVDTGQSGRPYRKPVKLNETGAGIWKARSEGRSPEEIASELAEPGGATAEEILEDVKEFLDRIEKELTERETL